MEKQLRKGHPAGSGKRWLVLLMCICLIGTMIPVTARAETAENNLPDETSTVQTSKQAEGKHITAWQWSDEEEYLDEETGSLSLPGASEQRPARFADVTALLPTQIQATVENAEDTEAESEEAPITLKEWLCEDYPEKGAYSGSYIFTAALPEGYALSKEAEALEITVELGGAEMYDIGTSEGYDGNGFCSGFKFDEAGNWVKDEGSSTPCAHDNCNGYQPAVEEQLDYDINGDKEIDVNDKAYKISSAGQLYWFANKVNNENSTYGSANAVLTADITVNSNLLSSLQFDETGKVTNGGDFRSWTPIGNSYANIYIGIFDGQNHTVSGLYFNDTNTERVGLFGYVGSDGKISNVGAADSYFNGKMMVGGVCGMNYGTIENCYNKGTVSGTERGVGGVCGMNYGTIENCYNKGTVSGTGSGVGGVCGMNYGTITNCYNTNTVSGNDNVGGVCGWNSSGTIENCYNTNTVSGKNAVGGVCGSNTSTITNCYNTGIVSVTGDCVGGVCGSNTSTIKNCYNTGTVSGTNDVGGVCGLSSGTITNCYYLEGTTADSNATDKTEEQFNSGEVAYLLSKGCTIGEGESAVTYNGDVWGQTIGTDNYPVLDSTKKVYYGYINCDESKDMIYSNIELPSTRPDHSYVVDGVDSTKHKCRNCGLEAEHSTATLTYTADEDTDKITVKCGDDCGKEYGTVTLSAPSGTLTYDGTAKAATVSNEVTGVTISNPVITYSKKDVSSFSGVPTTAGTYTASITLGTGEGAKTVSVTYEIKKAEASVGNAPSAKTGLTYDGNAQALVVAGSAAADTGTLMYSTSQNGEYSTTIPTGTDAKQSSVWYKVVGDENHSDTTPVEIKVAIAPLTITNENTTITLGTDLTYTGTKQIQSIASVTVGAMTLGAGDYTISNNTGTAAGNDYELTVTGTGNFTGTATKKFSIKKKPVTGTDQTLLVKTNQAKDITYDLGKLLPEGVTGTTTYKIGTVSDTSEVLSPDPSDTDIIDGKLTLHVASVAKKDLSATVKITFTNANYEISEAALTIQTTDKIPVILSGVTCGSRVYNGTDYAYTGTPLWKTEEDETANGETTVTYYKEDNLSTPLEAAPTNAGSYRAVFAITSDKYVGTASYIFEITKAEITVAAKDRNIYIGDTVPALTNPVLGTDYTVTGLCGTDVLGGTVSMSYEPDGQKPDNTKEGTYKILIGGLTAPEGDNYYTITFTKGTLTITPKPSGDSSDKPGSEGGAGGSSGGSTGGGSSFGGGNSSGSGSTSGVTTGRDSESNAATTTSKTEVKVENGTASATVKAENVAEAIKQAADNKSAEIVFNVSAEDTKDADRIQLTITKSDVLQILDKTSADLVAATTAGNVILPKEALKETVSAVGGDTITIEIDKVTAPTAVQKEAAGENSYIVEVTVTSQNKAITTFGGNVLKIRLEIPAALAGKNVAVIHIAEDGRTEKMPGKVVQDGEKQYYEFTTTHLSTFALIEENGKKEEAPADTVPKKGTLLTDSKTQMVYKVTKSGTDGGTVQFVKTKNAKAKTITIPDKVTVDGITYKVTSIAAGALKNNKAVTTVTIGRNVAAIGSGAFSGCTRLKKVTIGKSVTAIGSKAFYNCSSLTALTIPSKMEKIGNHAFKGCSSLKNIRIKTTLLTTKTVSEYAFSGISTRTVIKVPKHRLKTYKTLFRKKGLDKKVVIKKW